MKSTAPTPRGRPPKYTDPAELERLGLLYLETAKVPTITGLAQALGMITDTLGEYAKRPEFSDVVKKLRHGVAVFWEERLASNGCTGAIFWLKNNAGYVDVQQREVSGKNGSAIQIEAYAHLPPDEREDALRKAALDLLKQLPAEDLTRALSER